jgi:hypothetical protein
MGTNGTGIAALPHACCAQKVNTTTKRIVLSAKTAMLGLRMMQWGESMNPIVQNVRWGCTVLPEEQYVSCALQARTQKALRQQVASHATLDSNQARNQQGARLAKAGCTGRKAIKTF